MGDTRTSTSADLVAYYKNRVDGFEIERDELLERMSVCSTSAAETHTLRCEVQKRAEEVRELQHALSAAHVHLFEERDRLLQLQAENDELRLSEVESRKRIHHLQALCESAVPEHAVFLVQPKGGRETRGRPATGVSATDGRLDHSMAHVSAPGTDPDLLAMKNESLQAQLTEHKRFSAERIEALLEDRRIRERDEEAHRQNYLNQIESLTAKLKRTEEALRMTTKDYIIARRDKQAAQEKAAQAESDLAEHRKMATSKLAETKKTSEAKVKKALKQAEDKLASEVDYFKKQLKSRELEVGRLESMHTAVKSQYEQRVQDLESKWLKTKDKLKQAEYRRVLDAEGFTNDVSLLRKQLAAVDRKLHQMRLLDRLDDDERLHSLLQQLQKKAPGLKKSRNPDKGSRQVMQVDMLSETGEAADDLRAIKENLLMIEDRVQRGILKPGN